MPLIRLTVDVSEEELAVLRHCASGQPVRIKDIRQWGDAFLTVIRLGLVVREHGPLREFVYPASDIGRLVLEAAIQPNTDALKDAVEMCWGFFDQCCQDQRNMVPNREAMRDMCRHALDAAKAEAGEEG